MSRIVGVHGIAQEQKGRHLLLSPWTRALGDGMERVTGTRVDPPDLDIAFYGDFFLESSGDGRKGPSPESLEDAEVDFVLDAGKEVTDEDLAEYEAKGFPGVHPALLRLIAAIDRQCGQYAGWLFVGELRQARRYMTDQVLKDAVDTRVAAAIDKNCRVLIGHSLGSVVALEHIRLHPEHRFDLFLTIGSPLSLRAVRHLLVDASFGTGPDGPPSVRAWRNLRDPRDPVALGGGLSPWWPRVHDDDTIKNGSEPHSAVRYLAKRHAGAAVLDVASEEPEP